MTRVAVIGAGVAGVAAAWAAKRVGADVVLFAGRPGASELTSGAVDGPFASEDARAFAAAVGTWIFSASEARVASRSGVARRTAGRDASVLDFGTAATVAVARIERLGWDGDGIARALSDGEGGSTRFVAVDVPVLRFDDERTVGDAELAARHDEPARVAWLAARVAAARAREPFDALLVGPWLGLAAPVAAAVSEASGAQVGEVLSMPGGPAGLRLRRALDRVGSASARVVHATTEIAGEDGRWTVEGADGVFDAVVLATGGVAGGGVSYDAPIPMVAGEPPARFAVPAWRDAALAWTDTSAVEPFSPPVPDLAWTTTGGSVLERVGVATASLAAIGADRRPRTTLFVAGDLVAARRRTIGAAIESGVRAGTLAARAR